MRLLALAATTMSGPDTKMEEGDIIAISSVRNYIGRKESKLWIWLIITDPMVDSSIDLMESVEGIYKRRYRVSFADLRRIVAAFDPARARNADDEYQPFCTLEGGGEINNFITVNFPITIDGAIYDKVRGGYLT